jgi:hypothetical protein
MIANRKNQQLAGLGVLPIAAIVGAIPAFLKLGFSLFGSNKSQWDNMDASARDYFIADAMDSAFTNGPANNYAPIEIFKVSINKVTGVRYGQFLADSDWFERGVVPKFEKKYGIDYKTGLPFVTNISNQQQASLVSLPNIVLFGGLAFAASFLLVRSIIAKNQK